MVAEGGARGRYVRRVLGPIEGSLGCFLGVAGDDVIDRFLLHGNKINIPQFFEFSILVKNNNTCCFNSVIALSK